MKCWWCGSELIWQNDYTYEDYGIDGSDGIITVVNCSNEKCDAMFEGYLDNK